MQETFLVTAQTEDGKLLKQKEITGTYADIYSRVCSLLHAWWSLFEDSQKSETGHGSGIGQCRLDS